jgi:exoribonuclease II
LRGLQAKTSPQQIETENNDTMKLDIKLEGNHREAVAELLNSMVADEFLLSAESLESGRGRILVAVADWDALVRKTSVIDGHAASNTTSVYTPAAIFPMLPEALSTDLTSLNEDQERISQTK